MSSLTVRPSKKIKGTLKVDGDKSISHRAIIFGSLATGVTKVEGLLEAQDVLCTIGVMHNLGVKINKKNKLWVIQGSGKKSFKTPSRILYCGNSGTTLRLMTGLLSGYSPAPITASLTGDSSLNSRPMERVMEPLCHMGAHIEEIRNEEGRFIFIKSRFLKGGYFKIKVASAQLKSAILLAGLFGKKAVSVREPMKSRDHSERMLKAFGARIRVEGLKVTLIPGKSLKGQNIVVPGDFSSAAFFIVAGLISRHPKTKIVIKNIGMNPTRIGALEILQKMGGRIQVKSRHVVCGEPVADLVVQPSQLKGVAISEKIIPRLIDEIPILCIAASVAQGKTVIRGAEELRIKETDRIRALATELPRFGVSVKELKDGLEVVGTSSPVGAFGRSYGDHRIAMSLTVLATVAIGETHIEDIDCIKTSFPNFTGLMRQIGVRIQEL